MIDRQTESIVDNNDS